MKRFLTYALEKNKKLKAVYIQNDIILQKTVSVIAFDEASVTLQIGKKKSFTLPLMDLLACGYARGDSGEGEDEVGKR